MTNEIKKSLKGLKVIFVGAGNVATHFSKAISEAGAEIVGVHSLTKASSEVFHQLYGSVVATSIADLPQADFCIFAVKDSVLARKIKEFGSLKRSEICIHTAGSMPLDIFINHVEKYGVIYPLQTFSRLRNISFRQVPLFLEANNEITEEILLNFAQNLSDEVHLLSSEKREHLHLAAVFACNFSNHCYAMASQLLAEAGLSDRLLLPLITETYNKFTEMPAVDAQTGPAVRYDVNVMKRHLSLLESDELRSKVYRAMSESIHDYAEKKKP